MRDNLKEGGTASHRLFLSFCSAVFPMSSGSRFCFSCVFLVCLAVDKVGPDAEISLNTDRWALGHCFGRTLGIQVCAPAFPLLFPAPFLFFNLRGKRETHIYRISIVRLNRRDRDYQPQFKFKGTEV